MVPVQIIAESRTAGDETCFLGDAAADLAEIYLLFIME
jgi:hypothetical protein